MQPTLSSARKRIANIPTASPRKQENQIASTPKKRRTLLPAPSNKPVPAALIAHVSPASTRGPFRSRIPVPSAVTAEKPRRPAPALSARAALSRPSHTSHIPMPVWRINCKATKAKKVTFGPVVMPTHWQPGVFLILMLHLLVEP
jgi:hypothetical protein